ncbi:MAG TPA: HAMP domain-containing sensor histidine kinase [Noviherbaspirillum sp.]|nr:HAMP domain-containing sensor histidine kinase [Noviherbaspirillum sp.]
MRLATFIVDNIDRIIAGWTGNVAEAPLLGSQVKPILMAVAADMELASHDSSPSTPATVRAGLRSLPDFNLRQVSDELHALRHCVLGLWPVPGMQIEPGVLAQLQTFHSCVDQVVGEAITMHGEQVERTRSLFLGMLGHDLRTPLSGIDMACDYLLRDDVPQERKAEAVERISRCSAVLESMIRDVLDFARARLGKRMSITAKPSDIGAICEAALEQARAAHSRCEFRFEAAGSLDGMADPARICQALRNLLGSAAKNGARDMPVLFSATGGAGEILLRVKCQGTTLSEDSLRTLFDPIAQLAVADANPDGNPPADLGLGPFIAREIVHAHGGGIGVNAPAEGCTEFLVRLPR